MKPKPNLKSLRASHSFELIHGRVSLCCDAAPRVLTCAGETFEPDMFNAFVDFEMAHGFPVETVDGRGLHPQVVANSYRSLKYKVFNLAHFIKSYKPKEIPRDVVLGTILAVELTPASAGYAGDGRWRVQPDRAKAVGIRCVAVMHKQLDRVPEVLSTWQAGQIDWKVSMEQNFPFDDEAGIAPTSGWVVESHPRDGSFPDGTEKFWDNTPDDLQALGLVYVPCVAAPKELNALLDPATAAVKGRYRGCKATILFGGLNGEVYFKGAGLCPIGAEPEAGVRQMLASGGLDFADVDNLLQKDITAPLKKLFEKNNSGCLTK